MHKRLVTKGTIAAIVCVVGLVGALVATAVAQSQRFSDVPPGHYAYEAIEWASEVGVTAGYTDGTFKPERPLSSSHAVVFLERYYDEVLQADQTNDFTRGDMMVLLKAINDGTIRDTDPAPPVYPTYEAAVTAANSWYDRMEAIIGGGALAADWKEVIPQAAEKAAQWGGHDLVADRIRNEALLMSRTGDPIISNALSDVWEARFYLAAVSYSLAAGASAAAQQDGVSERDAASSAAWSAAGARLAELAQREGNSTYNGIRCFDCVLGGHNKFSSRFYRHVFNWKQPALTKAGEARNTYFEILA